MGVGQACLDWVDRHDAKAGHAERLAQVSERRAQLKLAARRRRGRAREPQVVAEAAQPVSLERRAQQSLPQRAREPRAPTGAAPELAVQSSERAQRASRQREWAPEFVEQELQEQEVLQQRAEPQAQERRVCSGRLVRRPLSRLFRLQSRLRQRHPVRPGPESSGELSRRRPRGWSSNGSSFP